MSEQEKKNEKVGIAVSAGIHTLLLLIFFFILAWRAPDPPLPDYGIELNFGVDEAGSGNEQPVTPASTRETEEIDNSQAESQPEPVQQEAVEEPVVEPAVAEEVPVAAAEEVVTQPVPSPVTREEVKKPTPEPEPKPEPKKEVPKPVVKTEPKKEAPKPVVKPEPVKEVVKNEEPKKETAQPALFPGESENTESAKANQGDREGAVGDQGNNEGTLDSRALYGEQGGGQGGAQLSIAGWRWDEAPNKKDQSTENGKIVFRFKIDDQGYVVEINTIETTVGPKVTQFYREQLQRTTFSTTSNAAPAPTTTGTVTFVIKAR